MPSVPHAQGADRGIPGERGDGGKEVAAIRLGVRERLERLTEGIQPTGVPHEELGEPLRRAENVHQPRCGVRVGEHGIGVLRRVLPQLDEHPQRLVGVGAPRQKGEGTPRLRAQFPSSPAASLS